MGNMTLEKKCEKWRRMIFLTGERGETGNEGSLYLWRGRGSLEE